VQDWTGDTGTRIGVEAIGSSEVVASTDQVTVAVSNGLQTETLTLNETATAQSSDGIVQAQAGDQIAFSFTDPGAI